MVEQFCFSVLVPGSIIAPTNAAWHRFLGHQDTADEQRKL
jgi:hypothetical protein